MTDHGDSIPPAVPAPATPAFGQGSPSGNLFAELPRQAAEEACLLLATGASVRIERIVSSGQASAPGFWYDQAEQEWVAVLSGSAVLRFADEDEPRRLEPGDWLLIPAHVRHRVEATDPDQPTVWLAVFFD
ncbi:MAG: cupin domain-containing protein [Azospirillum sp.]|nr:cupin domain-containing protein [Azospirillum sp.]